MGKSVRSRWSEAWRGSLTHEVIRHSGNVDVYITTGEEPEPDLTKALRPSPARRSGAGRGFALSALAVGLAGLAAYGLQIAFQLPDVSPVFLSAVLYSALTLGLWPSILASLLSVLVYDFFFVRPLLTLVVGRPHDLLSLIVYLIVAVAISRQASRTREQGMAARQRETRTSALYALSRGSRRPRV